VLIGIALVTVLVRMMIEGPTLLSVLTAALILALLLASLGLWQWGRRLRSSQGADRSGTTSNRRLNKEL
jgi:predicted membrane protein